MAWSICIKHTIKLNPRSCFIFFCGTYVNSFTSEAAQTIACSVIGSRIDYCNSLLFAAPVGVIDKLQRAQNNVARVICQQRKRVCQTIVKVIALASDTKSASGTRLPSSRTIGSVDICPVIPQRTVAVSRNDPVTAVHWCSAAVRPQDAQRDSYKRAFSVAAPNVWNSLPIDIRNTDCLSTFRNKHKTHFLPHLIHDIWRDIPTAAPLYLVSIGGLYGALQIWFYGMLCYVVWTWL